MGEVGDREALRTRLAQLCEPAFLFAKVGDGLDDGEAWLAVADELLAAGVLFPHPPDPPYANSPEFVPEWDIYRDANGHAVTVNCDYGHYDGPPLTDEQLTAVRRAVEVHRLVCEAEDNTQHVGALDKDGKFLWASGNAAKSRMLGRMIHDGKPPTRTRPPVQWAEPRWDLMPGGDPFEPAGSLREPSAQPLPEDAQQIIDALAEVHLHDVSQDLWLMGLVKQARRVKAAGSLSQQEPENG